MSFEDESGRGRRETSAKSTLEDACRRGLLGGLLEEYIDSCYSDASGISDTQGGASARRRTAQNVRFPNIAGFCRYLGCSADTLLSLEKSYPEELWHVRTVLEDEALNASMSPTVIAAYLKKRLGYEKESAPVGVSGDVRVCFEHDIWEDGE